MLRKGAVAGAKVLRDEMKRNAPVDDGVLRDNVFYQLVPQNLKLAAVGSTAVELYQVGVNSQDRPVPSKGDDQSATRVRRGAWYAHIVEYGRKAGVARAAPAAPGGKKQRKQVLADVGTGQVFGIIAHIPANSGTPFMRPAFDTHADIALDPDRRGDATERGQGARRGGPAKAQIMATP